jgi:pimeloyl-ACP methyl ester carboxylesterase
MPARSVHYNGATVHFTDCGEGTPVVFLHGYLEAKEIWAPFTSFFPDGIRVVCIDLPGHGQSTFQGETVTMEGMAQAIEAVLNHLAIARCIMVGHSMGGYAALAFAELYPNRLLGLSLFHSTANPDTPEKKASRAQDISMVEGGGKASIISSAVPKGFASDSIDNHKDIVEMAIRLASKTPDAGIAACLRGMAARKDRNGILANAPFPRLLIFGAKDNHITMDTAEGIRQRHASCQTAFLDGSGHMGFLEEPEEARRVILPFIKLCASS